MDLEASRNLQKVPIPPKTESDNSAQNKLQYNNFMLD